MGNDAHYGYHVLHVEQDKPIEIMASECVPFVPIDVKPYEGPYEVIPTREPQTLRTKSLMMGQDVTIRPIPSNYGLVTWDGSKITVS